MQTQLRLTSCKFKEHELLHTLFNSKRLQIYTPFPLLALTCMKESECKGS